MRMKSRILDNRGTSFKLESASLDCARSSFKEIVIQHFKPSSTITCENESQKTRSKKKLASIQHNGSNFEQQILKYQRKQKQILKLLYQRPSPCTIKPLYRNIRSSRCNLKLKKNFTCRNENRKNLNQGLRRINQDLNQLKRLFTHIIRLRQCINNDFKFGKLMHRLLNSKHYVLLPKLLTVQQNYSIDSLKFNNSLQNYSSPQFRNIYKAADGSINIQIDKFIQQLNAYSYQRKKENIQHLFNSIQTQKGYLLKKRRCPERTETLDSGQQTPLICREIEQMQSVLGQFREISRFTKGLQSLMDSKSQVHR